MKNLHLLIADAKDFMSNEVNRLFIVVLTISIAFTIFQYIEFREIENLKLLITETNQSLSNDIAKSRKRTDYRYFNLTRSLEDIYNVRIDTKTGELKR